MHLCEIEALALGQDRRPAEPNAEGQLPGTVAYTHSRPCLSDLIRPRTAGNAVESGHSLERLAGHRPRPSSSVRRSIGNSGAPNFHFAMVVFMHAFPHVRFGRRGRRRSNHDLNERILG